MLCARWPVVRLLVYATAVVVLAPALARAQEAPVPPAVEATSPAALAPAPQPSSGARSAGKILWITGLSSLIGVYVITGVTTTISVTVAGARTVTIGEAWVPVAGPWIMLADSAGLDDGQKAMTAVSGVLQGLALASFVTGLALVATSPSPEKAHVALVPMAVDRGGGLVLGGRF
jgi:hypothetical protein